MSKTFRYDPYSGSNPRRSSKSNKGSGSRNSENRKAVREQKRNWDGGS